MSTLTIVIRESDGTIHRATHHKRLLEPGICNVKMLKEDRQHILNFMSQGEDGEAGFVPDCYGFVLVDFKTKHILSLQGYTKLDEMLVPFFSPEIEIFIQTFTDLLKNGFVKGAESLSQKNVPIPLKIKDGSASVEEIKKFFGGPRDVSLTSAKMIKLDLSPFKLIDYEFEPGLDVRDAYKKIKELGFVLTKEEDKVWDEWMAEAAASADEEGEEDE